MIKKNSRLLLLALAHPWVESKGVPEQVLLQFFPALTPEGRRSLVHQLQTSGLLWRERWPSGWTIGATQQAMTLLSELYPALAPKTASSWHLLTFTAGTASDPQFRGLTTQLKKEHWLRLARGVYTHPFAPSPQLRVLLQTLYSEHCVLCTVGEWQIGFQRAVIVRHYGLEHLADLYSSISRETNQLLTTLGNKKGLNSSTIFTLSSVIGRFESALEQDSGLLPQVFEGSPAAHDVFADIARVVQAVTRLM